MVLFVVTPFISVTSPRAVDAVVPSRTTNCYLHVCFDLRSH